MKEQQPIGITELQQKIERVDGALVKANRVIQTIGTPEFGRPELDISPTTKLSGVKYLDAAVRVGMVKEALEERAKPTLLLQKENVEKEISLKKQQVQLEKIRELVQRGFLSESVVEQAQRSLGSLNQAVVSTEVPSGPERSNFIFPDGKMFSNLTPQETKILTSLLGTSQEKPISSYEWAQSVYGDDNNGNSRSKIGSQLPKIKRKISEAGWEIVTDFHGPLRGKLSPAWYYLQQKEATTPESQKSQAIDEELSSTIGRPAEILAKEFVLENTQKITDSQGDNSLEGEIKNPDVDSFNKSSRQPILTVELAQKLRNAFLGSLPDDVPLKVLKYYRKSAQPILTIEGKSQLDGWEEYLSTLDTRQATQISRALGSACSGTETIGKLRELTLERLSAKNGISQTTARFLTHAFEKTTIEPVIARTVETPQRQITRQAAIQKSIDARQTALKNKVGDNPKEILENLYTIQGLSMKKLAKKYSESLATIGYWLTILQIPRKVVTHNSETTDILNGVTPNHLMTLKPRERQILEGRNNGISLRQIGAELGISRERVRQIENKARLKLRRQLNSLG